MLLAAGFYAVTSRSPDPEQESHPTIDRASREALMRELERGDSP